jgi:hypothetical protein
MAILAAGRDGQESRAHDDQDRRADRDYWILHHSDPILPTATRAVVLPESRAGDCRETGETKKRRGEIIRQWKYPGRWD